MGNAKRTILVDIWDDPTKPNGLGFGMAGFDVQNDEIKCSKNGMKKSEPNKVTFEINNRSTKTWLFPTDKLDAMWVGANAKDCPKTRPAANPEFPTNKINVSSDREQLSLENLNSFAAEYKFVLNVVDENDPSQRLIPYDPIWNNQNGGH